MKNHTKYFVIALSILFIFNSCKNDTDKIIEPVIPDNNYIFVAHTRLDDSNIIAPEVQQINYNNFDVVMLGGDLTTDCTIDNLTMKHVDSVFNIANQNTLWALGNHDYYRPWRIFQFTYRNSFYHYTKDRITYIVLDTQLNKCNIIDNQLEMVNTVLDTVKNSSHVMILTHKLVWMYNDEELESRINDVSNGFFGTCNYCLQENNFNEIIYPKLVDLKNRGIEVLCIAGDIGKKVKKFEHLTKDGINFLASGINYSDSTNFALTFTHDRNTNELFWEFRNISEL